MNTAMFIAVQNFMQENELRKEQVNMSKMARALNVNRSTIMRYIDNVEPCNAEVEKYKKLLNDADTTLDQKILIDTFCDQWRHRSEMNMTVNEMNSDALLFRRHILNMQAIPLERDFNAHFSQRGKAMSIAQRHFSRNIKLVKATSPRCDLALMVFSGGQDYPEVFLNIPK